MSKTSPNKTTPKYSPYRAVSIRPSMVGSCEASRAMEEQRFLASEAPLLPLRDCSNPNGCRCKYKHWDDRRQDDRRSPFRGIGEQLHAKDDKRRGRDRRRG
jgi:hypothetical protein